MADEFTKAALYGIRAFNKKVKEKIGIEKLIGLLNEYEAERHKTNVIPQIRKGEDRLSYLEMNWSYSELLCISKRYGFIEWLVDNDKIAYDRYIKEFKLKDFRKFYYISKADNVIANLSIQGKPIEFLVSILK